MVDFASLSIFPVIVLGIILSIVEIAFVHSDEAGMGWLKHALHAVPFMFLFIFISMNLGFVLGLLGIAENGWIDFGVRALVGIVAIIKIKSAAAIAGSTGEKTIHAIIIGALVIAAPYAWDMVIGQLLAPYTPAWFK